MSRGEFEQAVEMSRVLRNKFRDRSFSRHEEPIGLSTNLPRNH